MIKTMTNTWRSFEVGGEDQLELDLAILPSLGLTLEPAGDGDDEAGDGDGDGDGEAGDGDWKL